MEKRRFIVGIVGVYLFSMGLLSEPKQAKQPSNGD
jgi:hypothetical protein